MENKQFFIACKDKNFKLAQQLFDKVDLQERNICFGFVCGDGHLEFAQWMVLKDPKIDIHNHSEFPFRMACKNGHLPVCKWLWDISKKSINLHVYKNDPFRKACKYGHINIVEWLFTLCNKNDLYISYNNYSPFINCCRLNKLEMAKLLSKEYRVPTSILKQAFYEAIMNKSIETSGWLHGLLTDQKKSLDAHTVGRIFSNILNENNDEETALWLIQLIPYLDYRYNHDEPFRICCIRNFVELAMYLTTLYNNYNLCIDNGAITKWCIEKN